MNQQEIVIDLVNISSFKLSTIKEGAIVKRGEEGGIVSVVLIGYRGKYIYYEFQLTNGRVLSATCNR